MPNITLKRFTGSVWEEMLPTPASHTHPYSDLTGTVPTWNQNTTGSAATLTTARTLTIGSTGKTFNGGGNVSWNLTEIGAAATNHGHGVTTIGDILISYDGLTLSRLGTSGSNNRFLKVTLEGSDLIPSWNPILDTDIPNISTAKLTSGTLGIARGGTGTTSVTAGGVVFGSTGGSSYTSTVPAGSNQVLTSTYNGVNYLPTWSSTLPTAVLPQIPGNWVLVGGSETTATAMAHSTASSVPSMTLSPGGINSGDLLAIEVSSNTSTTTAAQRNIVFVRLGTNQTTLGMGMMSFGSLNSTTTGNQNVWSSLVRYLSSTSIGTRYGGFENLSATGNKTFGTFYIFRVWKVID